MKKCMYISLEVSGNTVCFSFDPSRTKLFVDSFFWFHILFLFSYPKVIYIENVDILRA